MHSFVISKNDLYFAVEIALPCAVSAYTMHYWYLAVSFL